MFISIDPGTRRLACAIFHSNEDLLDIWQYDSIGYKLGDVEKLVNHVLYPKIVGLMHTLRDDEVEIFVEIPSPRFYGRANASSVLKVFWQALNFGQCLVSYDEVTALHFVDSYEWNLFSGKPMTDKNKVNLFDAVFNIEMQKLKIRLNTDKRDAALMGSWAIEKIRFVRRSFVQNPHIVTMK